MAGLCRGLPSPLRGQLYGRGRYLQGDERGSHDHVQVTLTFKPYGMITFFRNKTCIYSNEDLGFEEQDETGALSDAGFPMYLFGQI